MILFAQHIPWSYGSNQRIGYDNNIVRCALLSAYTNALLKDLLYGRKCELRVERA